MNIAGKTEQHNLGKVQSGNTYVLIASFDRIVKSYDTCMNNQQLMVFGAARVNRQELGSGNAKEVSVRKQHRLRPILSQISEKAERVYNAQST